MYFNFSRMSLFIYSLMFFLCFSIVFVVVFQSHDAVTDPLGWSKPVYISPSGVNTKNVNSARKGNFVVSVYEGEEGSLKNIYASISFDSGVSFLEPVVISRFESQINNNPGVSISSAGNIYVMWHHLSGEESESKILYSFSRDMGVSWSASEEIGFGMQLEMLPVPYFDNRDDLHLVFTAYKDGQFNLFHSVKENKKADFNKAKRVAPLKGNIRGAFSPSIKFDGRKGILVWQSKEEDFTDHLYTVRTDNYGQSWTSVDKITTGRNNHQAPSVEIHDDTAYVVFMDNSDKNWGIKLLRGYRMGARWDSEPVKVSETNANSYSPDIIAGLDNELLIVWHDLREKGSRIFYRKYLTQTSELMPENKLSLRNVPARNPVGIKTGKSMALFWEESGRIVRNYIDITVPPPIVYSRTHPEDRWSKNRDALVQWHSSEDVSGIAGYATLIDNNPNSIPSIQNYRYDVNRAYLTGLNDGITYFHIRAVDGAGNMSRTVHYPVQISANPLAMPLVVSPTHPENDRAISKDALFRWVVNDSRRLKGFLYSLEKDRSRKPDKLIQDFSMDFKDLEKGVYFFNIAAVSKTDQVSRVTTYSFIVGDEAEFDEDYIRELADKDFDMTDKKIISKPGIPYLEITFPFTEKGIFDKNSFKGIIKPVNIRRDFMEGYSVVLGPEKRNPVNRINLNKDEVQFADLKNGNYVFGIKGKYFRIKNGKKVYLWTRPVFVNFTINVIPAHTPLDRFYDEIIEKLGHTRFVAVPLIIIALIAVLWGFGSKISFYFKLLNYRIKLFSS
ncbi:MAG: sialidase family protein [Spirochaetota bacterium]